MTHVISVAPLTLQDHVDTVQRVYSATPQFWELHGLDGAPEGQAERDLREAEGMVGRTLAGIVHRLQADDPSSGFEMVGIVDFRVNWPRESTAHLGMLMVAEPFQRQGIGAQTLKLLEPWFANSAGITTIRLGVEQFNPAALLFFQQQGFTLTGETSRVHVGEKKIRLLFMEKTLSSETYPPEPTTDSV